MEIPTLIRYEQNQDTSFYLCRQCKTHTALHKEMLHKYIHNGHALFNDVVNVALGENYNIVTGQVAATAYCINCNSEFGGKFIDLLYQTGAIKNGRFIIDLKQLLLWKGNQMVYADTEEPVESA